MIEPIEQCRPLLRCPRTGAPLVFRSDGSAVSADGGSSYPAAGTLPVLIDFGKSVIEQRAVFETFAESPIERPRYGGLKNRLKQLVSPPRSKIRDGNIAIFIKLLKERTARPRLLVIGGGTIGKGMQPLYEDPDLRLIAFDIYRSTHAHFIADAHAIPLADGSFDGVVIQAVLEHVLDPARVVAEIWRVLGEKGLVYAETPFLQHVHEGPYDFTRFTESGHRYLFRRFELIRSGASAGAGAQLLWSLDFFTRSLFRSRRAGKAVKLAFFWLRHLDRFIPPPYASDAASGVFFLGRKSDKEVSAKEIIQFYRGAQ